MPTLEQIQAKLKKLQAQADVLIARKAQLAVDQIRELMIKHGLTTADIEAKAKAKRAANALHARAANGKAKAGASANVKKVAKYRDDKTGATWTGHGRAPGWIAGVKDRTQFLIAGASELKSVAKAAVTHAAGRKGQPKGAQPPKYLDPKTGATWSGRGPAPAWLAAVKDRSKFLIESAAAATGGAVGRKAAAKKVVAAKKTAASKTAPKKTSAAAKKIAAKKSAAKPATKKTATNRTAAKKAPGRKAGSKGKAGVTATTAAPATSAVQASA